MTYITIFSLILSLALMLKDKNKFVIIIFFLNLCSFLIALLINKTIGFYLYGFTLIISLIYFIAFSNNPQKKYFILFMIPVLLNYITAIFNFINLPLIVFSQFISIIIFLILFLKKYKISVKELSILTPFFFNTCINLFYYFN